MYTNLFISVSLIQNGLRRLLKCIASRKMVLELSEASNCHFAFFSQQQFLKFWRQKGKNLWASIPLSVLGLCNMLYGKNVIWSLCHVVIPSYGHCGITLKVFSTKRLFIRVILSKGHFINMSFCPRVILSKGNFINMSFCPRVIFSKGHFVQGSFCQRVILSKGHFVMASFDHALRYVLWSFDHRVFWS